VAPLGAECCHLAREILDTLQKCSAVGEWGNAHERRLGCGLNNAVCTASRGIQVVHLLQRKELADALLSQGGQPLHQLDPQREVGVSFRRG
jgi:hypothetical protein